MKSLLPFLLGLILGSLLVGSAFAGEPLFDTLWIIPYGATCQTATPAPPTLTPTETPTETPVPTRTPRPTETPYPTLTPEADATPEGQGAPGQAVWLPGVEG